jgi:hypothetical protein
MTSNHRARGFLVATIMTAMALAGCLGGGDGQAVGPAGPGGGEAAACVKGVVLDAELFPLKGATVGFVDTERSAQSDANGSFILCADGPGTYQIYAEKNGYASSLEDVTLDGTRLVEVLIELEAVGSKAPFHETIPHTAFIECAWAISPALGTSPCNAVDRNLGTELTVDNSQWFFEIPQDGLSALVMEAMWDPQTMGRDMRFLLLIPDVVGSNYLTGEPMLDGRGGSPYRTVLLPGETGDGGSQEFVGDDATPYQVLYRPWITNSTTGTAVVYVNHRVDSFWTFFYYDARTKDFSALPDA